MLIGCGGSTASGTTTITTSTGTSSASCVLSPALTIGPYFVDEKLNRSDLTADTNDINVTAAMPLSLVITVQHYSSSGCSPLAGAQVDLWHADAGGKYSDENSEGTSGETYLRGYQVTDSSGLASFKTIFPGWYSGRTVHIHAMVRLFDSSGNQTFEWETQFFFRSDTHHSNHGHRALQHPRHTRHQQQPGQYLFAEWWKNSSESH